MLVEDLMTTDVVTVHAEGTLRDATEALLDNGVGSVIVVDDDENPVGIVTETDVLEGCYRTGERLEALSVAHLSHRAVIITTPTSTVNHLAYRMAEEDVKKVPVMDDLDLVGIVTLTDVVWALSDIRKEAASIHERREEWDPNR